MNWCRGLALVMGKAPPHGHVDSIPSHHGKKVYGWYKGFKPIEHPVPMWSKRRSCAGRQPMVFGAISSAQWPAYQWGKAPAAHAALQSCYAAHTPPSSDQHTGGRSGSIGRPNAWEKQQMWLHWTLCLQGSCTDHGESPIHSHTIRAPSCHGESSQRVSGPLGNRCCCFSQRSVVTQEAQAPPPTAMPSPLRRCIPLRRHTPAWPWHHCAGVADAKPILVPPLFWCPYNKTSLCHIHFLTCFRINPTDKYYTTCSANTLRDLKNGFSINVKHKQTTKRTYQNINYDF